MAFIENIPNEAFEPVNWAATNKKVDTPRTSFVASDIRKEEDEEKVSKSDQLKSWLKWRSDLRKTMLKKWRPQTDAEVRKSRLADVARWALEDMGKDPEAIKNIKDDDLIQRLVGSNSGTDIKKLNAVNNYIANWWYADNVFNYLVWNTKSVYEEEKEDKDRWFTENAIRNVIATPLRSLAWISNMVQDNVKYWWKTITEINKESDIAWLWELLWSVSNEEYQRYKNWEKIPQWWWKYVSVWAFMDKVSPTWDNVIEKVANKFWHSQNREWFYKAYDEALSNWFNWDVEQYANYIYSMAKDTYQRTADKFTEMIDNNLADPEWPWSSTWKFWWELLELFMLPELKFKWATKIPWVTEALDALSKIPWGKKLMNLTKGATKLWVEWLEYQALEDAAEWELSSWSKYTQSALLNSIIWWIFRWANRKITWLSPKQQEAFMNKTTKEISEMNKITDNWLNKSNQEVTPYTKIVDILKTAKTKLKENRKLAGTQLEWVENKLKYNFAEWQKYDAKDMLNTIQDWFKKLWDSSKWWAARWPNAKYPEFFKDWVHILDKESKNTLNSITRNENWNIVKLWDEIEKLWNDTFVTTDRQVNATTSKKFYDWLKDILWDEWRSRWDEWIRTLRWVFDEIDTKFTNSLDDASKNALAKAKEEAKKNINLDNTFDEMIWRLDWTIWVESAEKVSKDSTKAAIENLFTVVKRETWIDLNNELWAWITTVSLRNPEIARQLVATIYPSQPWAIEFITKTILNAAKKSWVKRYASDYNWTVWQRMKNTKWAWWLLLHDTVDYVSWD